MRKLIIVTLLFSFFTLTFSGMAEARESTVKFILKDGFYGALVGALVGGAALAFSGNPEDHYDFISKGAAIGAVAGVGYGFYQANQSTATLQNGTVTVSLPAPQLYVASSKQGETNRFGMQITLFSWRY